MTKPEEYGFVAAELWRINKTASTALAETVFSEHRVTLTDLSLIPNLSHLLAELQKRSFLLGAVAMLASIDQMANPASAERKSEQVM